MMDNKIPIKGFPGYYVRGLDVYGRSGKKLKAWKRDVIQMYRTKDVKNAYSRMKIVWCANHNIDPKLIPAEYSFTERDGVAVCEMFGDKMSRVRLEHTREEEWIRKDYADAAEFIKLAVAMMDGVEGAEDLVYAYLQKYHDELEIYALSAVGGVGKHRAGIYADSAVNSTFEVIKKNKKAVFNPVGYMKLLVRNQIYHERNIRRAERTGCELFSTQDGDFEKSNMTTKRLNKIL